jgi:signal transduction histidine kinase
MLDKPVTVSDFEADIAAIRGIEAIPKILEVVCRSTGMRFAAVARVTESRWVTCDVRDEIEFGLKPGDELKVETTLCHEIRQSREAIVIDDVANDTQYCGHHTPAMYGFQSYISVPIVLPDGMFFGTLCALDPAPARLNKPETIGMFTLFAELIAVHLVAHRKLALSEASLSDERRTAELREQFIAVLGHDLRNPLASIDAGIRMLQRGALDQKAAHIVGVMQNSIWRMARLIDDVLDFARGRLGGGLQLNRDPHAKLEPALNQVVAELRSSWPERTIDARFSLAGPVDCDTSRMAQLFSNLLSNALTYGAADAPVTVMATTKGAAFELSVANAGDEIPAATIERLFLPFARGAVRPSQQGLGLGLYIASEIAKAHGGHIDVVSSSAETRFTFRMPLG